MTRYYWVVVVGLILLTGTHPASAELLEELSKSVVFLVDTPSAERYQYGTGFLVAKGNQPILATAEHIARNLKPDSWAVLRGADGNAQRVALSKLTSSPETPAWEYHPTADLAVLCLNPTPDVLYALAPRLLPVEMLRGQASAPSRSIPLTVLGFPLALGVSGKFSPISRETKAASDLLLYGRGDTKKPALFFITQDPSVGGFSGAPIFDTVRPYSSDTTAMVIRNAPVQIVGVVHGTLSDDTGGKLGAVTPAHLLREFIAGTCSR